MNTITLAHWLGGAWVFALGTVVGSFANVCIYRIPWQKSVIWPGSHCPSCLSAIASRDNVPILGWLFLRGRCRSCDAPISPRYPLIEALTGGLFLAVFVADFVYGARGRMELEDVLRVLYHLILLSLLLIATFIDYSYYILPDSLTVTGMVFGLGLGTLIPEIRPAPSTAHTMTAGFLVGLTGFLVGGGVFWAIRILGSLRFGKEAMGFGDVTLMAMIGSFLGWQSILPILFCASFLGLGHSLYKLLIIIQKRLLGRKSSAGDHEIPFGPYLSMAALLLMLGWPWLWSRHLDRTYRSLYEVARFMLSGEL